MVIANTNIINNTITYRGPAAGLKIDGASNVLYITVRSPGIIMLKVAGQTAGA